MITMLNFNDCINLLKDYIETKVGNNYSQLKVDFGKYGQMPAIAPSIIIYAEPLGSVERAVYGYIYDRKMKVNLFVCETDIEMHNAILKANQLAEILEKSLYDFEEYANKSSLNINGKPTTLEFSPESITFDGVYGDLAVMNIECLITYAPYFDV